MSRGNVNNDSSFTATSLTFGSTPIPIGSGTFTNNYVLTYQAGTLVLAATAAGPTPTLSAVLVAGNTTGASDVVITNGQQLTFAAGAGIRIGANGLAVPAPQPGAIAMGNAATTASGTNTIAIGGGASATAQDAISIGTGGAASQIGNVAVGALAVVTAINSVAVGLNAQGSGAQAIVIGGNASSGSGINNTIIGGGSVATTTAANTTILGQGCTVTAASTFVTQVGNAITTGGAALSNVVAIGTQGAVGGSNSVKVGRGVQGTGASNTAIGDLVTITGTASSITAVGQNITVPTATVGATFVGTAPTIGATVNESVAVGYLTNTTVANATVLGSRSEGVGASITSVGWTTNVGATGGSGVAVGSTANSGTGARNTVVGTGSTHSTTTDSTIVGYGSTTIGSGVANSIFGANSSVTNAAATGCVVLGQGSVIPGAFARCIVIGNGVTGGASDAIYLPTTIAAVAAGTAVSFDASGRLHPNTSSIRYKRDVLPLDRTSRVLDVEPVSYAFQKGRCGCSDDCSCDKREVGAIAEQVYQVLPEVVVMSKDPDTGLDRPESIQYERLCVFLIAEMKKQQYALVQHAKRLKLIEDYLSSLPDPAPSGIQDATL